MCGTIFGQMRAAFDLKMHEDSPCEQTALLLRGSVCLITINSKALFINFSVPLDYAYVSPSQHFNKHFQDES